MSRKAWANLGQIGPRPVTPASASRENRQKLKASKWLVLNVLKPEKNRGKLEPMVGIEPTTYGLRNQKPL